MICLQASGRAARCWRPWTDTSARLGRKNSGKGSRRCSEGDVASVESFTIRPSRGRGRCHGRDRSPIASSRWLVTIAASKLMKIPQQISGGNAKRPGASVLMTRKPKVPVYRPVPLPIAGKMRRRGPNSPSRPPLWSIMRGSCVVRRRQGRRRLDLNYSTAGGWAWFAPRERARGVVLSIVRTSRYFRGLPDGARYPYPGLITRGPDYDTQPTR